MTERESALVLKIVRATLHAFDGYSIDSETLGGLIDEVTSLVQEH